jgi:hypothetical protein
LRWIEHLEQVVMIVILLAWIAWVLGLVTAPWYQTALYWGTPPPLVVILIVRLRRYYAAVREAESMAAQRGQASDGRKNR